MYFFGAWFGKENVLGYFLASQPDLKRIKEALHAVPQDWKNKWSFNLVKIVPEKEKEFFMELCHCIGFGLIISQLGKNYWILGFKFQKISLAPCFDIGAGDEEGFGGG